MADGEALHVLDGHGVGYGGSHRRWHGLTNGIIHPLKEVADRDAEHAGKVEQPARPNTVGASFVLLHLLEGHAQSRTEALLAHAKQGAALAHPRADVDVNRIGGKPNSLVTSRQIAQSRESLAFMSSSNRPYGLT